jgi:hypothetical protein
MFDTILGYVVVTVGSALLAYATLGRLCGFHRPMKWQRGGRLTWVGELACGSFALCIGLAILQRSGVWAAPALTAWAIGYVSQWRAERRHAAEEEELRARNAANYPGVFDNPPPDDIGRIRADEFDVFDSGACTYLGRATRTDLEVLIDRFGDMPEQGPNDLFLIPESLEVLPAGSLSPAFVALLREAFEQREFLVLRWMPPSHVPARECHPTNG